MLLLFDLSNYLDKQYSVLFVHYNKNPVNFDEKNLKNYLISVKKTSNFNICEKNPDFRENFRTEKKQEH